MFMICMICMINTAIAKTLRPSRQEDAHEFLIHLIDSLQKSCLAGLPRDLPARTKDTTLIHRLFQGTLRSTVRCKQCGHESRCEDPFLDLALEVKGCPSVEHALRLFTKEELLHGANRYKCEKCTKLVDAVKHIKVLKAPPVLTVQLKRFTYGFYGGGKINKHVQFAEQLDLAPFMIKNQQQKCQKSASVENLRYRLYAVLVHMGSCNSGHYYCYVKSPAGAWYNMDDSCVAQVKLSTVLQQNAYVLFYTADSEAGNRPEAKTELMKQVKRVQDTMEQKQAPVIVAQKCAADTTAAPAKQPATGLLDRIFQKKQPVPAASAATTQKQASNETTLPSPATAFVAAPSSLMSQIKEMVAQKNPFNGDKKKVTGSDGKSEDPQQPTPPVSSPEMKIAPQPSTALKPARTATIKHAAPVVVQWDEGLESKRGKLDEVIAQEQRNVTEKRTDVSDVLFSRQPAKWDEPAVPIPMTSAEPMLIDPLAKQTKKFKRPSLMDAEYDRGKVKKRREGRWSIFNLQGQSGTQEGDGSAAPANPFTKFQVQEREKKKHGRNKGGFLSKFKGKRR
jgi:hypothetical protein